MRFLLIEPLRVFTSGCSGHSRGQLGVLGLQVWSLWPWVAIRTGSAGTDPESMTLLLWFREVQGLEFRGLGFIFREPEALQQK